MSQNAGRLDRGGNDVQKAGPGEMLMDQKKRYIVSGAGNQVIPAVAILAGIVVRSGVAANNADVFDSADNILAACPALDVGDSFEFLMDQGAAFTNTPTAGAGITLVNGGIAASGIKRYLLTCLAAGRTVVLQGTTTNAGASVGFQAYGVTPSQAARLAQQIQPGMLVSGTGIQAGTTVIGVNSVNGTVTLSLAATATGTAGLTFTPNIEIRGLYQAVA